MTGATTTTDGAPAGASISLDFNVDGIPAELQERPQWVGWRVEVRGGKATKVPMNAHTGKRASTDDRATWAPFDEAAKAARRNNWGIGYVFAGSDPFAGVDLDHCIDETGNLAEWARDILKLLNGYAETSPSGTGVKVWVRGKLPGDRRRKGNVEMYDSGRFFTVTGRVLDDRVIIPERQAELETIYRATFGDEKPETAKPSNGATTRPPSVDLERVIELICSKPERAALYGGDWQGNHPSQSEADLALCHHLAFFSCADASMMDAIFRGSGLMRPKWDQAARGGQTYGEGTVERAIAGCSEFYQPQNGNGHARWQAHDVPPHRDEDAPGDTTGDDYDQVEREAMRDEARGDDDDGARRPKLIRMSTVTAEVVRWLWLLYVPLGKLTLVIGDPGAAKSWLALYLCAVLSRGWNFFGSAAAAAVASSLYFVAEDGLADTVRPRLDSLGADPARVYVVDGWQSDTESGQVTLADLDVIRAAIRETDARLVVVDPVQAYLGAGVDMHRANEVRPILHGLARLAEAENVAIVVLMHMRKAEAASALYRALGTIDFIAAARSALLVARDPDDKERRIMVQIKNSIAAEAPSLAYRITERGLEWEGQVDVTVEDLLTATKKGAPKLEDAKHYLREVLATGWRLKAEVVSGGEARGIKLRTLERAGEELGVRAVGIAGTSRTYWTLSKVPFEGDLG